MMKIRRFNNGAPGIDCNGFTIIEVLVTMSILSIGLLGMSALITGILSGNVYNNRLTTATTLAQEKMEDVRRIGYTGVSAATENYGDITGFSLFKRATTVAANSPTAGMKTVVVSVYWDSDNKSVGMKTILTQ
ncbi:MAG: prepilin-type N-terminal cleavage/methylation domain-containing protein [Desulfobacteraceae bacterium]|nr:MAG: prepilin-type N-terminal cleavage/methylation domain-containing protein [Desulfobacteraceae bacterium]